jgi:hypothetical protein
MIRACTPAPAVHRVAAVLLALLAGTACHDAEAPLAPADAPSVTTAADSSLSDSTLADSMASTDSIDATLASLSYAGLPFGPTNLWATVNTVEMGPAPFTLSLESVSPNTIVPHVNAARSKRQRLVLAMTGGSASDYKTGGKFDLSKWKRRMNSFKTSTIRNAVANAVSDGTIVGNVMMDEPETPNWGGNISKSLLDNMAGYAKAIFPTLPMGVQVGPPGYRWHASERFHKVDFVRYQYNWWVTSGNVTAWRSAVLDQAHRDGVRPAFSLNVLDGGTKRRDGSWTCAYGRGTYRPNCRMSPTQVRDWGRALGPSGCLLLMWRYDDAFMSKSANRDAFRSVASLLGSQPRRNCRRP